MDLFQLPSAEMTESEWAACCLWGFSTSDQTMPCPPTDTTRSPS
jgi:hypothetical protein